MIIYRRVDQLRAGDMLATDGIHAYPVTHVLRTARLTGRLNVWVADAGGERIGAGELEPGDLVPVVAP